MATLCIVAPSRTPLFAGLQQSTGQNPEHAPQNIQEAKIPNGLDSMQWLMPTEAGSEKIQTRRVSLPTDSKHATVYYTYVYDLATVLRVRAVLDAARAW